MLLQLNSMTYIDKQRIASDSAGWIENFGYWITLNARTKDIIQFEQDLIQFATWLNDYCYGAEFKRNEKRLKIIAGIESGKSYGGLHSHLIVTHANDTSRSFQEINTFVRKRWYKICNLSGSIFGSMVDVQPLGNAEARLGYATKDINASSSDKLNIIYL